MLIGGYVGYMFEFLQDGSEAEQICQRLANVKLEKGLTFFPS